MDALDVSAAVEAVDSLSMSLLFGRRLSKEGFEGFVFDSGRFDADATGGLTSEAAITN